MSDTLTFAQYVHGTETERLRFERENGGDLYEHRRVYAPWDRATADSERRMALALWRGDESHRRGDCLRSRDARISCGTCALHGYEPRGGWGDDWKVKRDGPNYAGWGRVYVQAGIPIPAQWRAVFSERDENYAKYEDALGRDLVTFGHPGYDA